MQYNFLCFHLKFTTAIYNFVNVEHEYCGIMFISNLNIIENVTTLFKQAPRVREANITRAGKLFEDRDG